MRSDFALFVLVAAISSFAGPARASISNGVWSSPLPHELRLHEEGRRALAERVQMIRTAEYSLRLKTFLLGNDFSGNLILNEIRQRKRSRPNLNVQILLDYWGMGAGPVIPAAVLDQLVLEGIQLRYYNPTPKYQLTAFNQRDHGKLMVADCQRLLIGGRNLEDGYFGLDGRMNFLDRELWLQGALGQGACESFNLFWRHPLVSPHRLGMGPRGSARIESKWDRSARQHIESILPRLDGQTEPVSGGVTLISDLPGGEPGARILSHYLEGFITRAERTLDIESPTFIPKGLVENAFRNSILKSQTGEGRGPLLVSVLTNAPASMKVTREIDGILSQVMTTGLRRFQSEPSYRIQLFGESEQGHFPFRHGAEWSIHSKTYIRDRRDIMIGSYNLGPRSQNFSSELAVVVWGEPGLAEKIIRDMTWRGREHLSTSLESFLRRRPLAKEPQSWPEKAINKVGDLWKEQSLWIEELL